MIISISIRRFPEALGVDGDRFKRLYFNSGLKYGLISAIISHVLIGVVFIITTIIKIVSLDLFLERDFLNILENKLWLYTWKLHITTCVFFLIWTIITYYTSIRKIVKNQAVDNIRSLTR